MNEHDFFPDTSTRLEQWFARGQGQIARVHGLPGVGKSMWLEQWLRGRGLLIDARGAGSIEELEQRLYLAILATSEDQNSEPLLEQWLDETPPTHLAIDHVGASIAPRLSSWLQRIREIAPPTSLLLVANEPVHDSEVVLSLSHIDRERVSAWLGLRFPSLSGAWLDRIIDRTDGLPALAESLANRVLYSGDLPAKVSQPSEWLAPLWENLPESARSLARFSSHFLAPWPGALLESFAAASEPTWPADLRVLLAEGWMVRESSEAGKVHLRLHRACLDFVIEQADERSLQTYHQGVELLAARLLPALGEGDFRERALERSLADIVCVWREVRTDASVHVPSIRAVLSWLLAFASRSTLRLDLGLDGGVDDDRGEDGIAWLESRVRAGLARGELDASARLLEVELERMAQREAEERLARLWGMLGKIYRRRQLFAAAARAYERACEIASTQQNPAGEVRYRWRAVLCWVEAGTRTRALDALEQIDRARIAETLGANERLRIDVLRAELYLEQNHEEAHELATGLLILPDLDDASRAKLYRVRGDARWHRGQIEQAAREYEMAALASSDSSSEEALVASRRVDACLVMGDFAALSASIGKLDTTDGPGRLRHLLIDMVDAPETITPARWERVLASEDWRLDEREWLVALEIACRPVVEPLERDRVRLSKERHDGPPHQQQALDLCWAHLRGDAFEVELPSAPYDRTSVGTAAALARLFSRRERAPVLPAAVVTSVDKSSSDVDLWVAEDASWFRANVDRAEFVDLSRKHTARRLLQVLLEQHLEDPHAPVSFDAMFAAGWPGQQNIAQDAARNRLRVAIRRLRSEGIEELLVTTDTGYMLDPTIEVSILASRQQDQT